ncbi:HU family DNA-binding protein [Pandoraea sp. XJJ-1]|uniref:DNA-binding protein n=1 Tax=Pandoraea cepalis TaxID=2508294 RepID=A0A5E4VE70_9BURK|nr:MULTISPECIES: HU family DNA-binding protein [Pandoraea]MDN4573195.1 DNA-binding protein [Pandoraea cepalis]MDN4577488.1 DNA-binding protein [Pandoraea cepalis]OJY24939.1 MAG: DNA-binding protein [Pandoraea sp. 64-18]QBC31115.1 DNA-binding protein [Pandoraea sp. XY-2]WAL84131.1 HU family DNA-binding protein [Pandoraea sp. XJJ-1]
MATAKKAAAKKAPVAKKAPAAKKAPVAKKAAPKAAPKAAVKAAPKAAANGKVSPIKDALNKTQLAAHLAEQSAVAVKEVKAVLAALENTIVSSLHKKGVGEFTLHGLFKVTSQQIAAKAKRFGKDPFTGQERWFPAKPASVRVKVRPLKKVKDAAQ